MKKLVLVFAALTVLSCTTAQTEEAIRIGETPTEVVNADGTVTESTVTDDVIGLIGSGVGAVTGNPGVALGATTLLGVLAGLLWRNKKKQKAA